MTVSQLLSVITRQWMDTIQHWNLSVSSLSPYLSGGFVRSRSRLKPFHHVVCIWDVLLSSAFCIVTLKTSSDFSLYVHPGLETNLSPRWAWRSRRNRFSLNSAEQREQTSFFLFYLCLPGESLDSLVFAFLNVFHTHPNDYFHAPLILFHCFFSFCCCLFSPWGSWFPPVWSERRTCPWRTLRSTGNRSTEHHNRQPGARRSPACWFLHRETRGQRSEWL